MKTEVVKMAFIDDDESPFLWATVTFWDENGPRHNGGEVMVAIDQKDVPIAELKTEAIEKAIEFLKLAISAHS